MAHALANLRSCVQEFQLQDHEETTSNIHKRWCSKNLTAERYKFFCMRPLSTQETHDQWVTRLKTKARDCEFDQMNMKEAITLVVTLHTPIPKLQTAVIRDDMTFDQMMKLAQSMELAHREVSYMKANTMVPHNTQSAENIDLTNWHIMLISKLCRYCGETTPQKGSCKARGATCNNCGKKNHFSRVCESKKVNLLIAQPGPQGGSFYEYGPTEIKLDAVKEKLRTTSENYPSTVIEVNIDNTRITMQVDSGADANVIPWNVYEEHLKHIPLRSTKAKLQPYNSVTLPIKGAFEAQITANNNNNVQATFYVAEGAAAQSLMGKYTAFDLDVLAINVNHLDNQQTVKQVHTQVQHLDYREMAKHLTPIETSVELKK
ncbi:uncharacterized protein LOC130642309 [Hydractinia symbiolongicarpus]|uniref:uncharacterized protein LOC130642309 n=1 Tax=Hydractinia symbiolongicarpus TaxID=13093 RepID=UPI00254D0DCC|nr:uncharacterized protein LOC130642309 [Hydractinia symbiolongicarpus]